MLIQQGDTNSLPSHRDLRESQSEETRHWLEEDARYFLHQALSTPVLNVLSRTEGAYIYDMNGRKYLDLHGNGVHNVGFNNPSVVEAVKRQLDEQLAFTPRRYTNVPAVEFARKLCQSAPEGLDRVLFCPGGSEAIEMAVLLLVPLAPTPINVPSKPSRGPYGETPWTAVPRPVHSLQLRCACRIYRTA